jgi:glycogen operon protein
MARSPHAEGTIFPRGASLVEEVHEYNFSLYSQHAESVVVLLFTENDLDRPVLEYRLDPRINKTWMVWHCRLSGQEVERARYYAYRIDGPRASGPGSWHAYDPEKVLLDPYAMEVFFPPHFDRAAAQRPGPNLGKAALGILPRPRGARARNDDSSPRHLPEDIVIYEMHVRGFTRSPTSEVAGERRGTCSGVIDRIPHLKELGVTVVEPRAFV